jgi:ATP-dependent DNA helicase RecG
LGDKIDFAMSPPAQSAAQQLSTPVQLVPGVGDRRAAQFQRLGLNTARDVLFFFPRSYQDLTQLKSVRDFEEGEPLSTRGEVVDVESRSAGRGRGILGVLLQADGGMVRAVWFNQPYLRKRFAPGQHLLLSGSARLRDNRWEMAHPQVQWLETDETEAAGRVLPIYPLTEGLTQGQVRYVTRAALEAYVDVLEEVFPEDFLQEHQLCSLREALPQIHFPDTIPSMEQARRRFVYQELFILQLALAIRRQQRQVLAGAAAMDFDPAIDARIRGLFPFDLTGDQQRAIEQIAQDMAQPVPMNRLLQGDVGTGKTAVAFYAMLSAVAHGYQAAMMAPTEVLAQQHYRTLSRLLTTGRVKVELLTGAVTASRREKLLERIRGGEVDIVVGTQAIVQSDLATARLGMVVIDEQHKFGVGQRASLKQAELEPHYLVMTATPIPRTVTMTLFGDLEVSTLRESPPGRPGVHTYLVEEDEVERWWDFLKKKLLEGRQGYVITPLVQESEEVAAASLEETYESLANGPLEAFRLGLVHGRMKPAEKEEMMQQFRQGEIQVLVATTVVEVGVDVPNATMMTILGPERFGLSQLHQLRGRIARGRYPGYCGALCDALADDAQRRLKAFSKTTDGFELAEIDLAIRGPGDLFGTRQHGLPPLRIADLLRDGEILSEARRDAVELVQRDPGLASVEHARLRRMMLHRYGQVLNLGDVG